MAKSRKPRKNIEVSILRTEVNRRLMNPEVSQDGKRELCLMLEEVLRVTDNYKGFNYSKWLSGGWKEWIDLTESGLYTEADHDKKAEFTGPEYNRFYY